MTGVRDALLATQREARDREAALYADVHDEPLPADGHYRVQDHLAHLAAWRRRAVEVLRRTGGERPSVDEWNAEIYDRTKEQPVEGVLRDARDSWDELIATIEAMTEEQLHEPHPFNPDFEVWFVVFANGNRHFDEHAGYIAALTGTPA